MHQNIDMPPQHYALSCKRRRRERGEGRGGEGRGGEGRGEGRGGEGRGEGGEEGGERVTRAYTVEVQTASVFYAQSLILLAS